MDEVQYLMGNDVISINGKEVIRSKYSAFYHIIFPEDIHEYDSAWVKIDKNHYEYKSASRKVLIKVTKRFTPNELNKRIIRR